MTYDALTDAEAPQKPVSVLVLPMYTGIAAIPNDQPGPCMGVSPPRGPPFCGMYEINGTWFYDTEPSPTAAYMRPGVSDKIYVSTLTGVLWTQPLAQILAFDLDGDGNPTGDGTEVAGGFWAVVDFAFHDENTLYVVELKPAGFVPFEGGRLTKVRLEDGTSEIVAESDQLFNPTGIAIEEDILYITNNTLVPCDGHVIMARLGPPGDPDGDDDAEDDATEDETIGLEDIVDTLQEEIMDTFPEETSPDERTFGDMGDPDGPNRLRRHD